MLDFCLTPYRYLKKIKNYFSQDQSWKLVTYVHFYCVVCRKVLFYEKLGVLNSPLYGPLRNKTKKEK